MRRLLSILFIICVLSAPVTAGCFAAAEDTAYAGDTIRMEAINDELATEDDYRAWAQTDTRWGRMPVGESEKNVAKIGCCVTSVAKLIIQAGLRSSDSFDVATLVQWLNRNYGFTQIGNLYWGKIEQFVPGWTSYGAILANDGPYSSYAYNDKIISWIYQGKHMAISVDNGDGTDHWFAVDEAKSLATGQVYIMDSLPYVQNADVTLVSRYPKFKSIHAYTGGSIPLESITPNEPAFYGLKSNYLQNTAVTFAWATTENTTHYCVILYRMNETGNWILNEYIDKENSGFTRHLEPGVYRVLLRAHNADVLYDDPNNWIYSESDFFYFNVAGMHVSIGDSPDQRMLTVHSALQ